MNPSWLSFVPQYVARDILAHAGTPPVGREQRPHVVALFADVSGFTPMSEALSTIGKVGAEELTQVLNSYFEPMIDLVHSYGGIIAKFAGDAMTIIFPYNRASRATVTRRAVQCALDMQSTMERYAAIPTGAGTFSLAMKAGLAMGPAFYTTVGDAAIHLEHVLAGGVLDRCADAEHHATQGEVAVHNELLRWAGGVHVAEERGHFSAIAGLKRRASRRPLEPLSGPLPEAARATLAAYLHPALARRLRDDQSGFINEHRKVTMLFAGFGGFDYDGDPSVGARLQEYLLAVLRVVERYDGYLCWADMGDKGSKYIVLFGAPIAHENDEERALCCALEISRLPHPPARLGLNTGYVYCGVIGSERRQDYTVMGDAVNLAARLMQAAGPGQILVSGVTQRYVVDKFVWQAHEPITVKGKSGLIPIAELLEVSERPSIRVQEPAYTLPMVGREAELRLAADKIVRVLQGRGQILGITAEAGMGKSRLGAEIVKLATGRGLAAYGGACQSHGTTMSYLVWRNVWRGLFGLDPSWAPERQRAHLEAQLAAIDPSLVQRMPLLDVVLNIAIPDNELTQSLDAKLRHESLQALLLDCLGRRARQTPLLLVLEDCHWIDPLSHDLLEFVGRNLPGLPVLVVVLYRPPEADGGQVLRVTPLAHFSESRLVDFTAAEAEQLIGLKLAQQFGVRGDVPARLAERIQEKAQGNPFYIDEIVNFIHDRGIDPRDVAALERLDLPESLHSLIISRIDRLAEDTKSTLKVASVIGRLFRSSWLWNVHPQIGTPEQVKDHLDTLSAIDLIRLDKPEPELEYLFKHVVTQEVAYESMAVATRAFLHDRIGDFVETTYADSLALYVDVLAFHYGRSRNTDKQRTYFRRAGDAARAAYANQAAIDYYRRLLPLLPGTEQTGVLCNLGQVWQLIGQWADAEDAYRRALALIEADREPGARAQCYLLLGHLMWYKAAYPEALAWLEQARAEFERVGDQHGAGRATGRLGLVYRLQGNYTPALACFKQQAQLAAELCDKDALAEATGNMGTVYAEQGEQARALECYERQLAIATEIGNRRESLYAVGNMGEIYHLTGEYPRALANYGAALDTAVEIGDQHSVTIAAINVGWVYRLQGAYAYALASHHYALHTALALDERAATMVAVWNIAQSYLGQGRFGDAERLFTMAIALGRALSIPYFLVDALYGQAELHSMRGRYAEARAVNDEAVRVATQIERKDVQLKAELLSIALGVPLGQTDGATAVHACEGLLERWPEADEQAAIAYQLWRLAGSEDRRRQAAALYRDLYARTPNVEYRRRLAELGSEPPADPPVLRPLPDIMAQTPVHLDELLARVDALIAATSPDAARAATPTASRKGAPSSSDST